MRFFTCYGKTLQLTIAVCLLHTAVFAQNADIEYLHNETSARWSAMATGQNPDTVNVLIRAGHTVTIDMDARVNNLAIENEAVLNAGNNALSGIYIVRPGYGSASGRAVIINNGILGSLTDVNDGIALLIPPFVRSFTIEGTGKTGIASIRPEKNNSSLEINILQNAELRHNAVALTAIPLLDSNLVTDNINLNIMAGKTITITHPDGGFHGRTGTGEGGRYFYNIAGTLDLSATTATQDIAPLGNANSAVDLSIGGAIKFGRSLNIAATGEQSGRLLLNVLNNAVADASATTNLNAGTNFFITNGTGVLKRSVNVADVLFPVGVNTPSPVVLKKLNGEGVFSVSVKNEFDTPVHNSVRVVNKQWTITSDNANGNNVTVTPMWLTADQASGFDPSLPVEIMRYDEAGWEKKLAVVTGAGTQNDLYKATGGEFTRFGVFAVQNKDITEAAPVLSLYPNPAVESISLTFPEAIKNGELIVTTAEGKKVLTSTLAKGATIWNANVSGWSAGVYFVIIDNGGKRSSVKFIKL